MFYILNLIFAFLISPIFCMEMDIDIVDCGKSNEQEQNLLAILPKDILENEIILNQLIIGLIKNCVNSTEKDSVKLFLKQIDRLFFNKKIVPFLRKYFPAKTKNYRLLPFTSLLVFAAQNDNFELCKLILNNTVPTQEDVELALAFAINNNGKVIHMLVEYGANIKNVESLVKKAFNINLEELINNTRIEINYRSLLEAIHADNLQLVKYLFLNGAAINKRYNNDWTPLIYACIGNHEKVVELLLLHPDIEINAETNKRLTALRMASVSGRTNIVNILENYKK